MPKESNVTAARIAINNYTRQYWDEFTVLVENFDSIARIQTNNGTISGNFSICEGRFGSGGCFDGESGYVQYPNSNDLSFGSGDFTIEAWAKTNTVSSLDVIVSNRGSSASHYYILEKFNTDTFRIRIKDGTTEKTATSAAISLNTWYHVAGVRNSNNLYIFVNGALSGTTDITGLGGIDTSAGSDPRVGDWVTGGFSWNGTIDEVRISEIARRPVSALWTLNYTLASTEAMRSGARYYWKVRALDEGGEQGE